MKGIHSLCFIFWPGNACQCLLIRRSSSILTPLFQRPQRPRQPLRRTPTHSVQLYPTSTAAPRQQSQHHCQQRLGATQPSAGPIVAAEQPTTSGAAATAAARPTTSATVGLSVVSAAPSPPAARYHPQAWRRAADISLTVAIPPVWPCASSHCYSHGRALFVRWSRPRAGAERPIFVLDDGAVGDAATDGRRDSVSTGGPCKCPRRERLDRVGR